MPLIHWIILFELGIAVLGGWGLGPGVLKFGFGRDMPQWNLKVDPYKYEFFEKK